MDDLTNIIEDEIIFIRNKCNCYYEVIHDIVGIRCILYINNNLNFRYCSPTINCLKHIDKKYYTHKIKQCIRLKKLNKINGQKNIEIY